MDVFDALWLATTLRLAAPLLFAATGELISERAGVLNIGLEGMMLTGAFFGFLATWSTGSPVLGVLSGLSAGVVLATIMAVLAVGLRADQIVVGIGLNIVALGASSFAFRQVFDGPQVLLERPQRVVVPGLSDIPFLGYGLFRQPLLVYVALLLVPFVWFLLYRTAWGLTIRAAGEVPEATDAAGASTALNRWAGTLTAGAFAGIGGSFLSIELGVFVEGMTAGRGFLALAAVIFGRWRPFGVLGACLVFGAADALQLRLQSADLVPASVWTAFAVAGVGFVLVSLVRRRLSSWTARRWAAVGIPIVLAVALALWAPPVSLPAQLWRTIPYVLSLAMLASVVGRSRMPTALAVPYRRGA